MFYKNHTKPKRSLGALRKARKTKARSPDLLGKIHIEQQTIEIIVIQLRRSQSSKIVGNLAGWFNEDETGQYITVELQPSFQKEHHVSNSNTKNLFDEFYSYEGGDEH